MKTVRAKILTGFITVLVIGITLGISGIAAIKIIEDMSNEQQELQLTNSGIKNICNAHYTWRQLLTESVLNGKEFTGSLDSGTCALGQWIKDGEAAKVDDPEIKELLNQITVPHNYIHTEASKVQELIKEGDLDEARFYLNQHILPKAAETIAILTSMDDRSSTLIQEKVDGIIGFENTMMFVITVLIIAAGAVSVIISIAISNGIEKKLEEIINSLESSTTAITSATVNLAEASENLADGSSKQAAAIEETSATMNESSSMIAQTAENTKRASEVSAAVAAKARQSIENMRNMIDSMEELKESSGTIAKIINKIDEISLNTNLLAINATVEAARASGDTGRSFAVVADEVRNLAKKSAQSAAETSDIINQNMSLTNKCGDIIGNVADDLGKVINEIDELDRIIGTISIASDEQSRGISQVNSAIAEMTKITQQNAAVAEETSASSNNLKEEMEHLEGVVSEATGLIKKKANDIIL